MTKQPVQLFYAEYKGQQAVVLESDILKVIVLPRRGGKTASILHKPKGFELLAQPSGEYPPLVPGMDFSKGDACGFDDAFPSIDGEKVMVDGKAIIYPDHGEIWTMPMEAALGVDSILLVGESTILPYRYQKEIRLNGDNVCYHYDITHTGGVPFPCLWACHGLTRYEPDMQLLYPSGMAFAQNVLAGPELGETGVSHPLTGGAYNFAAVPAKESRTMVKYYLQGRCPEGRCGIYYPTQGVACEMEFDHTALPYLGFWLTAGGYRGEYNCAFEPATGYYDSISRASKSGTAVVLSPGQTLSFSLSYRLFCLSANEQQSFMEGE
jgi:hypothetical protein